MKYTYRHVSGSSSERNVSWAAYLLSQKAKIFGSVELWFFILTAIPVILILSPVGKYLNAQKSFQAYSYDRRHQYPTSMRVKALPANRFVMNIRQ